MRPEPSMAPLPLGQVPILSRGDQNSIETRGSALTGAPFHFGVSGCSPSTTHFIVEGTATIELRCGPTMLTLHRFPDSPVQSHESFSGLIHIPAQRNLQFSR